MPLLATAVAKLAATPVTTIPTAARATDHSIFSPIARPIADVLAAFYSIVPNYGVAIILLSVAWMVVIAPLTLKSTRAMLAMQKLQPQLNKLKAEHKNDRQAFAAAQMELFKEHAVSPFGSCLPTLLPLPVFFALFRVIDGLSHHVKVNGHLYADPSFLSHQTRMYKAILVANGHINAFGLDLSKNALSGHSSFAAAIPFYVLLLLMIGTQYLQTAQMMSRNPAANDNPQMKMMKYLPIFFGVICVRFPAGVILYYAMSNVCRMTQQTLMYRYDPKVRVLAAREVQEVEAMTRDIDRRSAGPAGPGTAKKPADTPPARSNRFRDALNQATRQAADGRAKRAADSDPQAAKSKPGSNMRPPAANRPGQASPRPANGPGSKGKPANPAQPGKSRARGPAVPAKPGPGQNGAPGAKPVTGHNATRPPPNPRTTPKVDGAANGNRNGVGDGRGAPPDNDRSGTTKSTTNGNGAKPVASSTGNGSSGNGSSGNGSSGNGPSESVKPPGGAGAGRTGASQPRTPPRKRRGR